MTFFAQNSDFLLDALPQEELQTSSTDLGEWTFWGWRFWIFSFDDSSFLLFARTKKPNFSASLDHKLSLLYLANDVMQNSRKKFVEFVEEFSKVIHKCVLHAYTQFEEAYKQKKLMVPSMKKNDKREAIKRIIQVWKERKVVENSLLESILGDIPTENNPESSSIPQKVSLPFFAIWR